MQMANDKTPAIPGVVAYFTVSDSKAATAFYEKAFGARLIDRRETPDGRSMHVHVEINGGAMMFNDPFPEHGTPDEPKKNVTLHVIVDDADAWWKRATDAGAEVVAPLEVAFWGDKYGQLKDPFGVTWGIVGPA
jgi:PhnB protein